MSFLIKGTILSFNFSPRPLQCFGDRYNHPNSIFFLHLLSLAKSSLLHALLTATFVTLTLSKSFATFVTLSFTLSFTLSLVTSLSFSFALSACSWLLRQESFHCQCLLWINEKFAVLFEALRFAPFVHLHT